MKTSIAIVVALLAASVNAERRVYVQIETTDLADFEKAAQIADRFGATHLAANQVEPSMWQWNDAMGRKDPYPNWTMHRPAFFKFFVPEKLRGYLPVAYSEKNIETLRGRAKILKAHGLKAVYSAAIDPSYLPEKVFVDHPEWRGPRCDHPRRARMQYYAPCIDNPEVREMYRESIRELCKACPFEYFDIMANDSGAGFCHFDLYTGRSGPDWCWEIPREKRLVGWLSLVQEAAAEAGCKAEVNFTRYLKNDVFVSAKPLLKDGQSLLNLRNDGTAATSIVGFPNRFGETSFPIAYLPRMVAYAKQLQSAAQSDANVLICLKGTEECDAISLVEKAMKKPIAPGQMARYQALAEVAAEFVGKTDAEKLVQVWDDIEEVLVRLDVYREWAKGAPYGLLALVHQRWLTRPLVCFPERLEGEERNYWRDYIFQATTEDEALDYMNLQGWHTLDGNAALATARNVLAQADGVFAHAISALERLTPEKSNPVAGKYLKGLAYRLRLFRHFEHTFRNYVEFCNTIKLTKNEPMFHYYATAESPFVKDDKKRDIEGLIRSEIGNTLVQSRIIEDAAKEGLKIIQTADAEEFTNVMNLPPEARLVREMRLKAAIMEKYRDQPSEIYRKDHAKDVNY